MNHYVNIKDIKFWLDSQIAKLKEDLETKNMTKPDRDSIMSAIAAYQVFMQKLDEVFKGVGIILEEGYDVGYVLARKEKNENNRMEK